MVTHQSVEIMIKKLESEFKDEQLNICFPIICDDDYKLMKRYGLLNENKGMLKGCYLIRDKIVSAVFISPFKYHR